MVIVFHLWQGKFFASVVLPGKLSSLFVFGQTGVDLFFVLSGFLITRIVISTRGNAGYFWTFYARRSLRIFPLYYLALLLFYIALPLVFREPSPPASQQWWYWIYLQNIPATFPAFSAAGPGHFWSLAVEEHFYLIWPALVWMTPTRNLPKLSLALVIFAIATRVCLLTMGYGVFFFTPCRIDALAMGTLLAAMEPRLIAQRPFARKAGLASFVVLCVLIGVWPQLTGSRNAVLQAVKFTAIAFVYFGFIGYLVSCGKSGIGRILCSPLLVFAGTISYGLYVYHPFCIDVIQREFNYLPEILRALIAVISTFLVSIASFYCFERMFLRLKPSTPSVKERWLVATAPQSDCAVP